MRIKPGKNRKALAEAMDKKGISVYRLAKATDISETHARMIVKGLRNPGLDIARKIAAVLENDLDILFPQS